jgi:hypothetical protein
VKEMAELDPLSDDLRALLDAEGRREEPPSGAPDRVLLRLGASLGPVVPLGHPGGARPHAAEAGPVGRLAGAARLARAATIFVAGAASGVGGSRALEHRRARPLPAASDRWAMKPAETPPTLPRVEPPPPSAAQPAEVPLPLPPPRPHRSAAAPAPEDDGRLAAERNLLEIARAALVRGQADGALGALARHEATFPRGELTEEREGLFVQALVAARRYDEARVRAARFARRYPRSLFAPVVAQALGAIP